LLAQLWALIGPTVMSDEQKIATAWGVIVSTWGAGEAKAYNDAKTAFLADVKADKGIEEAAADAWTTFFGETSTNTRANAAALFKAFLQAFGVPQS
jgi:hypothetical protein